MSRLPVFARFLTIVEPPPVRISVGRPIAQSSIVDSTGSRARSAPAGLIRAGRAQQLLDVRLDQAEADVSVKLLTPLVGHEARTPFDSHSVGILVVRGQTGEGDAAV